MAISPRALSSSAREIPFDVPKLLSLLLAAAGIVDLLSALTPSFRSRLNLVQELFGMQAVRLSHTATVLVGLCLLMLARSIGRRHIRGARLALTTLVISSVLNLVKGLDVEEASFCLFVAAMIWRSRDQFVVGALPISWRGTASRTFWLASLIVVYAELGVLLLHRSVQVLLTLGGRPVPFPVASFLGLWTDAPTVTYTGAQGHWFRQSLHTLVVMGILYAVLKLLRPLIPISPASPEDHRRARSLLSRHGSDALCYFHLRSDRSYIFTPNDNGFVSFVVHGDVALLGGDPVAAPGAMHEVVQHAFEVLELQGLRPCVMGASEQALLVYRAAGMRAIKIGEEAIIDLTGFSLNMLAKRVRRAARHIDSLGIQIRVGTFRSFDPLLSAQFEPVSRAWLQARGDQDWGFSMTSGALPTIHDEDHQIAAALTHRADGSPQLLGFLTLAPVPAALGLSLDHMRRLPDAPNGLTEALIIGASEHFQRAGYRMLSLNFAALSDQEHPEGEGRAVRVARKAVFEHARHLPLRSLYTFNKKFNPSWSCRYWLYHSAGDLPDAVYATLLAEIARPSSLLPAWLTTRLRPRARS